uniref:Uncharacterized protein n=1 Tax=Heterorhabditis bacteriophora TaxID=37862 RepID=A0A1I7WZL1_HETBA
MYFVRSILPSSLTTSNDSRAFLTQVWRVRYFPTIFLYDKYSFNYRLHPSTLINYIFSCDGVFRTEDFLEAFEEFSVKHSVFDKNNLPVIVANRKYIQANYNAEKKLEINSDHYPCYLFYMTAEQRELILNEKIPELPQGYTLGKFKIQNLLFLVKKEILNSV